ncbi:pentapeptide repeat-containing protein [Streptomyces pseudogriseolus]|uniref:pentapeptide repeat-containing protein n=1 Tax=Streptomyces pseudogriseolus TaxID=36817 RepID=UPI003FA1ACCF
MTGTTGTAAWPRCGHPEGGGPCPGRRVDPYPACLAHLDDADRAAHLATLSPGADLDHRGTPLTQDLLDELLAPLRDPGTGRARVGRADFDAVRFSGEAEIRDAGFGGYCSFTSAVFDAGLYMEAVHTGGDLRLDAAHVAGDLWLDDCEVDGDAWFIKARVGGALRFCGHKVGRSAVFRDLTCAEARVEGVDFERGADFTGLRVTGTAGFEGAHFLNGAACFDRADIGGDMPFDGARFDANATFEDATIGGDLSFVDATARADVCFRRTVFRRTAVIGPLVCPGTVDFSDAVFESAVTLEVAAKEVRCVRTRWASTAALRLRYADVDLTDATPAFPVSVVGRPRPFVSPAGDEIAEPGLARKQVCVVSVKGVDAACLMLADVDLTRCLFVEAVHLDQLRLEGRCRLAEPPAGPRWIRRRTLAEEHHWRATRYRCWTPAPDDSRPDPDVLAPVYRQLRKALEDGRNEPGAADFYYGEMEMRRHSDSASRGERTLLWLYWALSGYGLRATRALAWLLLAMTATVFAIMLWGLPKDEPDPVSEGTSDGRRITLTTRKPTPVNPDGAYSRRISGERFEKSLRVVANSVIFRASGQDLTTTGTYVEMTARLVEPGLLALAVLAVRSRVKR